MVTRPEHKGKRGEVRVSKGDWAQAGRTAIVTVVILIVIVIAVTMFVEFMIR